MQVVFGHIRSYEERIVHAVDIAPILIRLDRSRLVKKLAMQRIAKHLVTALIKPKSCVSLLETVRLELNNLAYRMLAQRVKSHVNKRTLAARFHIVVFQSKREVLGFLYKVIDLADISQFVGTVDLRRNVIHHRVKQGDVAYRIEETAHGRIRSKYGYDGIGGVQIVPCPAW